MKKSSLIFTFLLLLALITGCSSASAPDVAAKIPPMPTKITKFEDNVPVIEVYVVEQGTVESMSLEEYLGGVLAGEMKNDWPMEALKAQAILARTFALRFMTEKESKYEGAYLSTDIEEAQAYDASSVNDRVRQAVSETRGLVLSNGGEFPYAWFHAHSGGKTGLAKEALNWKDNEPNYTLVTDSRESDKAPADAKEWSATFSKTQVIDAAKAAGYTIQNLDSAEIGEKGKSGRAITLKLGGQEVNAPDFRIAIGSTEMRSTFLTDIKLEGDKVTMSGKGFGHGVGMSQWGAYGLAEQGQKAEEIVLSYFQNVEVVKMY